MGQKLSFEPRYNPLLIGHPTAETALVEAMSGGRLHHAWLIAGPEGVGKATLAYRFARALLAGAAKLDMSPDHPVFRRVAAGTHADLLTVEREWDDKKKRLKKLIAAESVREIPAFLHLTAAEAGWRVVIVDGVEDASAQSANALLKVLEEPPTRAVLILVCSAPGRLLPTLRSRCRRLSLSPLSEADMQTMLAHTLPETDVAERATLVRLAQGSPGRAQALAIDGGLRLAGMVSEVLHAGPAIDLTRAYEMSDVLRDRAPFELFMALLQQGIAAAVGAVLRGVADEGEARLVAARSTLAWAEVAESLGRLTAETERANMDRRQALVAALSLIRA